MAASTATSSLLLQAMLASDVKDTRKDQSPFRHLNLVTKIIFIHLIVISLIVSIINSTTSPHARSTMAYNNTCLSLTTISTPDPHVTYAHNKFYLTFTAGDRVEIWRTSSLPQFITSPEKHIVWRPPPGTHYSNDLWAPELHQLQGRWYIYVAAAHPHEGNRSHRMYVLGGPPATSDPVNGTWTMLGPIANLDPRQWAIDGTVIELNHQHYFVYSGWPIGELESDLTQELFIVRLRDHITAESRPTSLCQPIEPWERSDRSGINEGPQFLQSPDGNWTGLVYSCAGSWTKDYKMNTLQYLGGDPLHANSWHKGRQPLVVTGNSSHGPFGPGHGSFVQLGNETMAIFHATDNPTDGWENRRARMQRVVFKNGQPFMGGMVGPLTHSYQDFLSGGRHGEYEHESEQKQHGLRGLLQKVKDRVRDEL